MFFQFMTRLDDRLKTIETNVTKSVGELDDIKKTVRSISGTVTTVHSFRSNLKAFRSSDSDSMCVQILILS
jgi:hypothetical protein